MLFRKKLVPTIIGNNGVAAEIYDKMKADYRSPTIGVWFHDNDYLEFVKDV